MNLPPKVNDNARLSKLLFEAQEAVDMYADVVERRSGKRNGWLRKLSEEIGTYRTEKGWSPNGFGGEE